MAEVGAALITPVFSAVTKGVWAKLITSWTKPHAMTAFLKAGTNTMVLAELGSFLSHLKPLKKYDDVLKLDAALFGTHTSVFLSNAMGALVPTTTVSFSLSERLVLRWNREC